jgi:hypothetical protein
MCDQIYLSSDHPLPLIPFDPDRDPIWIRTLEDHAKALQCSQDEAVDAGPPIELVSKIRQWLRGPYVYFVGSWMGCSCGFEFREYPESRDERRSTSMYEPRLVEHNRKCRASSLRLSEYLDYSVRSGDVELLVCWLGQEDESPKPSRRVSPHYFRGTPEYYGPWLRSFGLRLRTGDHFVVSGAPGCDHGQQIPEVG